MKTANKNLDKKHHGAISGISGYRYEVIFFIQKLVELLLQNSINDEIIAVTRTKKNTDVDDVYVEAKTGNIFIQCKKYSDYDKELFKDFLNQFKKNQNSISYLITQNKIKWYAELTQDARKFAFDVFSNNLDTDSQLAEHKKKFESLLTLIEEKNEASKKRYLYEFLKNFAIIAVDDLDTEKRIKEKLIDYGYSSKNADNIFKHLYIQADTYGWQGKAITLETLKQELKSIGIIYISKEKRIQTVNKPISKKSKKIKIVHTLHDPEVHFSEKLSYLLDLIANLRKPRVKERVQSLEIISKDATLSWHFLKNLKEPEWFPIIRINLVNTITKQDTDTAIKYQLLNYLEICCEKYSDEIIPLLIKLEKNTKDPYIISSLIKIIGKLKPTKKEYLSPIWKTLERLGEHRHPWVRKEIPATLISLVQYDLKKALSLLENLFLYKPVPQDVTLGSPTLALTFQGSDNENRVFEEAVKVLSELMVNPSYTVKAYELAIKLQIKFLTEGREKLAKERGITLDYSSIWLSDKDPFKKLEFMHDRKERLALEIEKYLDKFAQSDELLANKLFRMLLKFRHEVFYLAVIKVLTRHPDKYLALIEQLVFDKNFRLVTNIRNYFLQSLVQKYFELRNNRLQEYVNEVENLNYKNNKELTNYIIQDLLGAIPECLRSPEISNRLSQIEKELKTSSEIKKPFTITSFSGPRPDISIEELKAKTMDEMIKIMDDSTAGKRAESYDLSPLFAQLIKDDPDKLPSLFEKIKEKEIDQRFSGEMMIAYIETKKMDLPAILNTFWKLKKTDRWARIEVARFFNTECRKKEIINIGEGQLKEIKNVLFDLSEDKNPEDDGTIKSSNPRPADAITRGINSVRGLATEILVVIAHYFPKDKEVLEKLKILSKDTTTAVKATLIYNLKYLIKENYSFCKYIVNQFKSIRDPEIDFTLIHYFAHLGPKKFSANIDFVKLLFTNPNKEIQKELGELIARKYIRGFDLDHLVEAIIKQQIGDTETRQSLAFIFESSLGLQMSSKKHREFLGYYKKLLDPHIEPTFEVRNRAAFAFERDDLQTKYFEMLYKNKVFDVVIKDKLNIAAQSHLISYLHKCILANESVDRCIEILHKQIVNADGVWGDQLIVQKISGIVKHVFNNKKTNKKTTILVDEIFDKGLERGWEEFYNLFYEFKQAN